MPDSAEMNALADRMESYLVGHLLPFWQTRSPDRECGGFLSHFGRDGRPTGETVKTYLSHIRLLFVMSIAQRYGYAPGLSAELARWGADFLLDHYWDDQQEGWFWMADRQGKPTFEGKVGYGQVFGVYAFSEYCLATGDPRGREAAERTYSAICKHMADTQRGGLHELMQRDWQPERPGRCGGDRKSMDVHMHWMEALTSFYEMTGHPSHRRRLMEVIDLILGRMIHPEFGTGWIQFTLDFQPLAAILFATEWGRDQERKEGQPRPLNSTSYGHNIEFAWLLLHACDVLGIPRSTYADPARRIFDHCLEYGIDWQHGGVFVEGPHDGPTTITESKQFWQQAETMVGMLDAYALFGQEKYWRAFRNVHDFVFARFVNLAGGGEWYERVNREGKPLDDVLGHGWKSGYHTVRATVLCIQRLRALAGGAKQ
jgi:mannobiose 2-epimerase